MTSTHRDLDLRAAALALLLSALWGGNPVAIKIGLLDAGPFALGWMRFVLGGLSILAWAWWTGALKGFTIERHEWRPLAILGALFTVQIGLMNLGTHLTSASHSAVLLNAYAVHTMVLAHFRLPGDRLRHLPGHAWNWDDRAAGPSLTEGKAKIRGAVIGGVNQWATVCEGTPEDVTAEVKNAVEQTDGIGLIVGPGCVLPPAAPDQNVAALVKALGGKVGMVL